MTDLFQSIKQCAREVIKASGIFFTYPDGTKVLDGIDFSVKNGEFVGILGGNGSGKTTFLRLMNGLLKPTGGDIYLQEENIKAINRNKLFTFACTVFQDPDDQL